MWVSRTGIQLRLHACMPLPQVRPVGGRSAYSKDVRALVAHAYQFLDPLPHDERVQKIVEWLAHHHPDITKPYQYYVERWCQRTGPEGTNPLPGRGAKGWRPLIGDEQLLAVLRAVSKGNITASGRRPYSSLLHECPEAQVIVARLPGLSFDALRDVLMRMEPDLIIEARDVKPGLDTTQRQQRRQVASERQHDRSIQNPEVTFWVDGSSFILYDLLSLPGFVLVIRGTHPAIEPAADARIQSQPRRDPKRYNYYGVVNPLVTPPVAWVSGTVEHETPAWKVRYMHALNP